MMGISPSVPPGAAPSAENGVFGLLALIADPEAARKRLAELVEVHNSIAIKLQAAADLEMREKKLAEREATVANDRAAIEAEKVALAQREAAVAQRDAEFAEKIAKIRGHLASQG